ncbi:MAG: alpha amylase catalytic region [Gemmatimonadetes bacterium]|nr:alpha amylase catalytic region [Gemmatimonadota bacterium]
MCAALARSSSTVNTIGILLLGLAASAGAARAQDAPAWTRGATCYEVFVRSFQDSDGDGIGDLNGLTARLDYINDGNPRSTRSLGARCLWLMPVAESPSYHGYDVTDYYRVAHDYGTNEDFERLVAAAHKRGIKVLVDLVLNHTSNRHPHFLAALRDSTSSYRAWYRWSPTKLDRGTWGSELWHKSPERDEYYYGLFSSSMPDLNYENPAVRDEANRVGRFWLDSMHVDGFRLDAVSFLVEHGAQIMHTRETHQVLHDFQQSMRAARPDVYTVGEVTFPNATLLSYYADQLTSYFAFEVADSLIAAVRSGSARGLLAPALQLERDAPTGRWSPFLRNHDQPRTLTELGGDMARARVAALLLLTMPGMPFVYYGEEIGMSGGKPDERIRTPMQWSSGHEAGFTPGTAWEQMQGDSLTRTVSAEERDPSSLLALYRRLIHLRARCAALAAGALVPLQASDDAVAAYLRRTDDGAVLIVANLSAKPLAGVSIESAAGALGAGRWRARDLLARTSPATLEIDGEGRVRQYIALPTLAPMQGHLFALARTTRTAGAGSAPTRAPHIPRDACSD